MIQNLYHLTILDNVLTEKMFEILVMYVPTVVAKICAEYYYEQLEPKTDMEGTLKLFFYTQTILKRFHYVYGIIEYYTHQYEIDQVLNKVLLNKFYNAVHFRGLFVISIPQYGTGLTA